MNTTTSPFTQTETAATSQPSDSAHSRPSRARVGKIARLPEVIRSQINQRLRDGEAGSRILPWLNALPEVRRVLADYFGGKPISDRNLTSWRQGGFADDCEQREGTSLLTDVASSAVKQVGGMDNLSDAATALTFAKIIEFLKAARGTLDFNQLGAITRVITHLRNTQTSRRRIELNERILRHHQEVFEAHRDEPEFHDAQPSNSSPETQAPNTSEMPTEPTLTPTATPTYTGLDRSQAIAGLLRLFTSPEAKTKTPLEKAAIMAELKKLYTGA